jgi:hypothetical protein
MNDSMVDRLDEQEPVTITEALEIPQPRAVGSPLPRGNGSRVTVPPTYADLEDRMPLSHPGPVLAPPPSNFSYSGSMLAVPAVVPAPKAVPVSIGMAAEPAVPIAPAPVQAPLQVEPATNATIPARESGPTTPPTAVPEHPRPLQTRSAESPSTLQRAAGIIRHAIPIVQKLLPLLDGNVGTAISNILHPPPPAPPVPTTALAPPPPTRIDLTPIKESIADLQTLHKDLSLQMTEQSSSLKRVEDHLELVREATDRNTLEQQELLEDLKSMGFKVNLVAAIAIGLLAISLLVNMALYVHIQRVLP